MHIHFLAQQQKYSSFKNKIKIIAKKINEMKMHTFLIFLFKKTQQDIVYKHYIKKVFSLYKNSILVQSPFENK